MRNQEFENIIKLEPFDRYKHFVKKIADYEEIIILENDNKDAAISQIGENVVIHFWPKKEYAETFISNEWIDYKAVSISLDEFEEEFTSIIVEKGYLIDVFPVDDSSGFVVSLNEFIRDLNEELENY